MYAMAKACSHDEAGVRQSHVTVHTVTRNHMNPSIARLHDMFQELQC